jgi:hypothetical protein
MNHSSKDDPSRSSSEIILSCELKLVAEEARPGKLDSGSEAGDVNILGSKHIREHGVLAGRNLLGDVDALLDRQLSRLEGALEVDIADLLAEVRLGVNETDKAVLDGEHDVCALLETLFDSAGSLNHEFLAGSRGVGRKVDSLDGDKILVVVARAEFEGRVAGNLEVVVGHNLGSLAGVLHADAKSSGRRQIAGEAGGNSGEPHRELIFRCECRRAFDDRVG